MFFQKVLTGSLIGSIKDTQECIEFCDKKNIVPATELVSWHQLNDVFKTLSGGNDRVIRYVLDLEKSLK
jgi:D-arabinose 1-dehydrogenase-like Zn-dependent alcohol dehydrogenase